MSSMEDRLVKLREERIAREKARLQKLREINLKKYNKTFNGNSERLYNETIRKKSVDGKNIDAVKERVNKLALKKNVNTDDKVPVVDCVPCSKIGALKTYNNSTVDNVDTTSIDKKDNQAPIPKTGPSNVNKQAPIPKTGPSNVNKLALIPKTGPNNINKQAPIPKTGTFNVNKLAPFPKTGPNNVNKLAPIPKTGLSNVNKQAPIPKTGTINVNKQAPIPKTGTINVNKQAPIPKTGTINVNKQAPIPKTDKVLTEIKPFKKIDPTLTRKSTAVFQKPKDVPKYPLRKSLMPNMDSYTQESVFDRLYKPKSAPKPTVNAVEKLQTDQNYLKKVIKTSGLLLKRHTCFENHETERPVRRSISAVHFKRISKNELGNCIHKWASIGDNLNKQHLTIDEAENVKEDCVVSAVKSERKKVKFMTPMSRLNTPRPDELQARLKSWLQKRGKSLDAYHHLQCFGIQHLAKTPLQLDTPKIESYNDENKENIALDSDSDDGSYTENMNERKEASGDVDIAKWRQTSFAESELSETADLNETTMTSADTFANVDDLLTGALNDLAELLREGFDWEQSARYLRAIRERFPAAPRTAAYWECRAALEERRGDLHASVQCWEEAIAKGTERKVVEANLDTLLNKFMQLKISPNSKEGARRPDPKMVDVKNVFKSTIIRFAVQQAKLRQSETPVFTVTPVRRSGRLSHCPTPNVAHAHTPRLGKRTPLRLFDSVRQVAATTPQHVFKPNDNLVHTP